jgi:hypothetical protein
LDDYADALETNPVTSVYAALGRLKAEHPALSWGEYKELQLTTRQYAFARVAGEDVLVTVLNNDDAPARLEFDLPVPHVLNAADLLRGTVGAQDVEIWAEGNRMAVTLPANYGTVLQLH